MSCAIINTLFATGGALILLSVVARWNAWQSRLPSTPASLFWTDPLSLFKPRLYSVEGNMVRIRALWLGSGGAVLFLASLVSFFVFRNRGLSGTCWFAQ